MERYAFISQTDALLDMLITKVHITSKAQNINTNLESKEWAGLWDTGASKSSINKQVAIELGLIPIGRGTISTANGVVPTDMFLINLTLPNDVTVTDVLVSSADLGSDIDLLIGMDIIKLGDFAISNENGKTSFTFRKPPRERIDFVKVERMHKLIGEPHGKGKGKGKKK